MICNHCNTENDAAASYCFHCGYNLHSMEVGANDKNKFSDIVILLISAFMLFNKLLWGICSYLHIGGWKTLSYLSSFFSIFWAVIPLLLAFVVKNKTMRIVLIVIGGVYVLLSLIEIIKSFSRAFGHFNF